MDTRQAPFALTVDLHPWDSPPDVEACAAWLASRGLPATFFVSTRMLADTRFERTLRALAEAGHALGTHTHTHSAEEADALRGAGSLDFLARSADAFERFFGLRPRAFRTPCWTRPTPLAFAELERLGYTIDSSATPQRLGLLSSFPFENPWLFSPRAPHFRGRLLEIPTTTLAVPLCAATFNTLRTLGALAFVALFLLEARAFPERAITVQLHPSDFAPSAARPRPPERSLRDFLPLTGRGFAWRLWIRDTDPRAIAGRTQLVLDYVRHRGHAFVTLHDIEREVRGAAGR